MLVEAPKPTVYFSPHIPEIDCAIKHHQMGSLNIKYKNQVIKMDIDLATTTLGDLVANLVMKTGLTNIKLIFKGMVMKDYLAYLKSFNIKDGSNLLMMAEPLRTEPSTTAADEIEDELPLKTELESAIDSLKELDQELASFDIKFKMLENALRNPSMTPIQTIDYQSRELGELLMKLLLKIDKIVIEDQEFRLKRRDLVKRVQSKLDESDGLKERVMKLKKSLL